MIAKSCLDWWSCWAANGAEFLLRGLIRKVLKRRCSGVSNAMTRATIRIWPELMWCGVSFWWRTWRWNRSKPCRLIASIVPWGCWKLDFFRNLRWANGERNKRSDSQILVMEDDDSVEHPEPVFVTEETFPDDDYLDALVTEGDEDASLVCEYENAAADLIQSDPEVAACYNAYYVEARKRLADRFRSRLLAFVSERSWKRKQGDKVRERAFRINSVATCRAEFSTVHVDFVDNVVTGKPSAHKRDAGSRKSMPISFTSAQSSSAALPLEFVQLPQHVETPIDEPQLQEEFSFCVDSFNPKGARRILRDKFGGKILPRSSISSSNVVWNDCQPVSRFVKAKVQPQSVVSGSLEMVPDVLFASHGSFGFADLGASKTVIGSELVSDLVRSLHLSIRSKLYRCPCQVKFRFGNQSTLSSQEALVIPLSSQLHLKVAVVPSATPFLLSIALLRFERWRRLLTQETIKYG